MLLLVVIIFGSLIIRTLEGISRHLLEIKRLIAHQMGQKVD